MAPCSLKWTGFRPSGRLFVCLKVNCPGRKEQIWSFGGDAYRYFAECPVCDGPTRYAKNRWLRRKRCNVVRRVCSFKARSSVNLPLSQPAVRRAMAFQSGTALARCQECGFEAKFFKLYQSFRPDHAWKDEDGRTKAALFCINCEVKNRQREWKEWSQEEKDIAGEDYAKEETVKKEQKKRSRESWAARSEPIKGAKAAVKALRENWSEQVCQVNYVQCMEQMKIEDTDVKEASSSSQVGQGEQGASHDGPDSTGASDDGPDSLKWLNKGASHDGPEGASHDGPPVEKRQRTGLPEGRSDQQLVEINPDKKLTSKQMKLFYITKSKDLARGLLGLMKGQNATLGAFAKAGQQMLKQLSLYERLKEAQEKWETSQTEKDFDSLEMIEDEYEKAHEYQTAAEHGEEEQVKYLKALDYGDNICEGWRRFFCCKAGGA